ncbi:UNVERIFIED_CONTAM: hypothetical protein HDU68_006341, partial [Siphonaria sp. JEL0065]
YQVNVLDATGHLSKVDGLSIRFCSLENLCAPDLAAIRKVLVQTVANIHSLKPADDATIKT